MTALRQRMEDDMVGRGFADRTRESYSVGGDGTRPVLSAAT
jgi:hypothetical protein